ncbi:MAG TPA: cellulase family glycosylhydrolase [Ilumatobacteraceae bacterium]|nr:cellulase family glycosylhydrolase [Ilumatobacteraceae bacterium]
MSITVKSSTTRRGLVDVEIYGPSGQVFQQFWDNQAFTKNVSRTFTAQWNVPTSQALGTRTIKVGMFSPGWGSFQHWNDSAGALTVTAAATTTTTAPTTTSTVPATTTTRPSTTTTTTATTTTTTTPSTTTTTTTIPSTTTTAAPTTTTTTTTTIPPTTTTTIPPTTTTGPPRPPAQPPTRLNWVGSNFFATGVNVPWMTWPFAPGHGDFGGGNSDGVVARRAEIAVGFAKLQASGTHVVRWWAFQGDAWQINRDANGWPTSLNPAIYADFDAAMSLANQYDLYYNFVLFGGPNQFPSTWRTNAAQRAQLATVLAPLFARYKDNPRLMSWEIFNEPEWEIWNSGGVVTEAHVKAMAVEIIKSIRLNAPRTLVTVGQALVGGFNSNQRAIAMWTDVDLDFYSPHWYSPHTSPFSICAMCTTAPDLQALYNTSKPIVIGEFDQGLESTSANTARLNQWYSKNYAGAWGWSLFHENTNDRIPTDFVALTNFNSQHSDIGPRTP